MNSPLIGSNILSEVAEWNDCRVAKEIERMLIRQCLLVALLFGVAVLPARADLVTGPSMLRLIPEAWPESCFP